MNRDKLFEMRKRHNTELLSLLSDADRKMFKVICDKTFDPYKPAKCFTYDDFKDDVMSYGGYFIPNVLMFKDIGLITEVVDGVFCINGEFREIIRDLFYGNV